MSPGIIIIGAFGVRKTIDIYLTAAKPILLTLASRCVLTETTAGRAQHAYHMTWLFEIIGKLNPYRLLSDYY